MTPNLRIPLGDVSVHQGGAFSFDLTRAMQDHFQAAQALEEGDQVFYTGMYADEMGIPREEPGVIAERLPEGRLRVTYPCGDREGHDIEFQHADVRARKILNQ